jgi:HPt (histidine-containing phosphotransfer) domain-containing protein
VLDLDLLDDLLASLSQPLAVATIYKKFVVNARGCIAELPRQDAMARIDTLHTLKGSAATMGAKHLALVAARLQTQTDTSPVQIAEATQELTAALSLFRSAASEWLSARGAPGEL